MTGTKLRTKTGCFTCRQRRVKCDEEKPSCRNCAQFGRICSWPSLSDIVDRRSRPRGSQKTLQVQSPERLSNGEAKSSSSKDEPGYNVPAINKFSTLYDMAHPLFRSETERELIHYFLNFFFRSLTLPTQDDTYFSQCLIDLIDMMARNRIVKHAVLASCASNKHVMVKNNRYRLLALQYYSRAVTEMNQELETFQSDDTFQHSCLLTAVSFFYVFGFWGIDATSDPRPHVDGAVKLLSMKSHEQITVSSTWNYDRVNIESVLYQAFLLATRRPFKPNFHLDLKFVSHAEALLDLYTSSSSSSKSPSLVLGVPLSLYRLIIRIMDCYNITECSIRHYLRDLRVEMDQWEQLLLNQDDAQGSLPSVVCFKDLMILAASLLLDLVTESLGSLLIDISALGQPDEQKPWRWQMDLAMVILQCPEEHDKWSGCFLGAWPLLILGYGARTVEEITLVKDVLSNIRQRTGYGEVQRIREELDEITGYKIVPNITD